MRHGNAGGIGRGGRRSEQPARRARSAAVPARVAVTTIPIRSGMGLAAAISGTANATPAHNATTGLPAGGGVARPPVASL